MLQIHSVGTDFATIKKLAQENHSIESLEKQLTYLHCYGGLEGDPTHIKVDLYPSKGLYFDVAWFKKSTAGIYEPWMNGGLVHHEHDNTWSIHT